MRSIRLLPLVLLIACGDNKDEHQNPDAKVADAEVDARIPLTCGFTEAADTTNDDLFGTGTAEATSLSFMNAMMICGKFDNGHYENGPQRIDVDSYAFTVPAGTHGTVSLQAPGAESFDSVLLEVFSMNANVSEVGQFVGSFAVVSEDLPAGDYIVTVVSYDAVVPAAALDYKIILRTEASTRCAKSTATATYTEARDTMATASENDVYEVRYQGAPRRQVTAITTDMPEPTGINAAPGMTYRVTGTNITPTTTPASWADSFQDRDTYQITMGPNADMLSIRLNWPGTTMDFDFFVFPMDGIIELANGWDGGNMEDEFLTMSVTPNSTYWIMVGADDASTGQPITYDLTLCGDTYVPE